MIGQTLSHFQITAKLGEGGMGEVYRAKDTRLDREVAIKVLPTGLADNEQFLERFDREAKTISSLDHPNICTLYDVGEEDGSHYIVMELIEGETLADRLEKGPLPLDNVLRNGQQIASALDAAHRRGITHRDLKPGNIMLTKSGAKLLDFGLAKTAAEGPAPLDGLTSLPTEAKPLTEEGTILGTFQYMAPEQLEGLEADARTDIFALGAVLYEMATGQRAFQGGSKTSLIAEIVASQPAPISTVIEMAPPALDHVVQRCLEKDPDDRWQSVHDVASELQWISEAGSQADAGKATVASPTSKRRVLTSVAVAGWIIAATFTWALMQRTSAEVSPRSFRAELVLQEDTSRSRLSPDGKWIIYSSDESGLREIYLSDFPAGRMKWQVTQRNLKGVAFDDFGGAEWGPRGDAVFYKTESGIVKVPVRRSGDRLGPGSPELIEFDTSRIFGRFKPDGETFLALTPAGDLKEEPIQIIWNWRQMLERSNP